MARAYGFGDECDIASWLIALCVIALCDIALCDIALCDIALGLAWLMALCDIAEWDIAEWDIIALWLAMGAGDCATATTGTIADRQTTAAMVKRFMGHLQEEECG